MTKRLAAAFVVAFATGLAQGAIDLRLQPVTPTVNVGDPVSVRIVGAATSGLPEPILSFQVIFSWDTSKLRLTGFSTPPGLGMIGSGFLSDAYGLNESAIPSDGGAIFIGLGPLASSISVPPGGLLLSTLQFTALAPAVSGTPVSILPRAGSPSGTTVVFGAGQPNFNVTGSLTGTSVTIIPSPATVGVLAVSSMLGISRRRRRR